jgi:ATP-binding cassette subfamily G (WHITE) protein 2
MLLSEGRLMYFGAAADACSYFAKLGYELPPNYNPADYLLDIISLDTRTSEMEKETRERILKFEREFAKTLESKSDNVTATESLEDAPARPTVSDKRLSVSSKDEDIDKSLNLNPNASFWTQFRLLFTRSFREISRDKFSTVIKLFQTLFFAILIGLIYLDIGNAQGDIVSRSGLLFFININQAFGAMFGVLSRFPIEKTIFIRENCLGFYGSFPYFMGRIFAEMPFTVFFPFLNTTIIYWMVGLQANGWKYILACISVVMCALCSEGIGLIASTLAPNVMVANIIAPLITIVFLLFGGFYIQTDSIPSYFKWVESISYLKYSYRVLMVNEFSGLSLECSTGGGPCYADGESVLDLYGMRGQSIVADLLVLLLIIVVLRVLSYTFLLLGKPRRTRV